MSYDISLHVKLDEFNIYPVVAEPVLSSPTYNLGPMFRACMDWDFSQSKIDKNGEYQTCHYKCDFVLDRVEAGIRELRLHRKECEKYTPKNGWGSIDSAVESLESLRDCIYKTAETIPLECLYMSW